MAALEVVWVKVKDGGVSTFDKVPTKDCDDVADLREAIKKKFSRKLGEYDAADLIVSYAGDDGHEVVLDPRRPIGDVPDDKELTVNVALAARECPCRAPVVAALCACVCARASLTLRRVSHCRRRRGWCSRR